MSEASQNNLLLRSIGRFTQSYRGEQVGEITEVKTDDKNRPEYIILRSSTCFGRGDRFFAVPATSNLIKFTGKGTIILQVEKDDLQFAKGIAANMLPGSNSTFTSRQSIFELYNYIAPKNKNASNNN